MQEFEIDDMLDGIKSMEAQYPIPIKTAVKLSELSYQLTTVKVGDCECYITEIDGIQVVVPRGTEGGSLKSIIKRGGWRDIIRDVNIFPWKDKRVGWMHKGFLRGSQGLVDKGLFGLLRRGDRLLNEHPIFLTGHSLGGDLALGIGAILHSEGFNVVGIMTFGAARAFRKGTAKKWNKTLNIWQFSNTGDPIPRALDLLYDHCREFITCRDSDGMSLKNHGTGAYKEAFSSDFNRNFYEDK